MRAAIGVLLLILGVATPALAQSPADLFQGIRPLHPAHMALWVLALPVAVVLQGGLVQFRKRPRLMLEVGLVMILALGLRLVCDGMVGDVRPITASVAGPDRILSYRASPLYFTWVHFIAGLADLLSLDRRDLLVGANALVGALSVAAVAWAVWEIRRDQTRAVLAGLALSVFPPHVLFSASGAVVGWMTLVLALAVANIFRALRTGSSRSWVLAALFLGAVADLRPEGLGYVAGALILPGIRWRHAAPVRAGVLPVAGLILAVLLVHPVMEGLELRRTTDLVPAMDMTLLDVPRAWARLMADSVLMNPLLSVLCFIGLTRMATNDLNLALTVPAAMMVSTFMLVGHFMPRGSMLTDWRYYLPALVFTAIPVARALHDLGDAVDRRVAFPGSRIALGVVLLLALNAGGLLDLRKDIAARNEMSFVLEGIDQVPEGCTVAARAPSPEPAALEPSGYVSWLARRDVRWVAVTTDFREAGVPPEGCLVFYRGGRCDVLVDSDAGKAPCEALERSAHLEPIAEARVGGQSLVSERYRKNPFRVGFYRVLPPRAASSAVFAGSP